MAYNPRLKEYKKYTVDREVPLLEYLLATLPMSRNKVKDTLQGRGIKVNGKTVTQYDYPLVPGTVVEVSNSKKNDNFKSKYVNLVYEDQYLVVIEKKPGILSMAAGHSSLNVKTVLDEYFKKTRQKCRAHVVHRLDRDTSGLMIYAKDIETAQTLERAWHELVYDRRYVALLSGHMEQEGGTVHNWLKDNKAYITYSSPTDNGGKEAVTHYRRLKVKDNLTLCEMKLETGRKNQIRVHMADLGYPVCGDEKYGDGRNPVHRLALHAYRLFFTHPVTGEDMRFETPFPKAFTQFFED